MSEHENTTVSPPESPVSMGDGKNSLAKRLLDDFGYESGGYESEGAQSPYGGLNMSWQRPSSRLKSKDSDGFHSHNADYHAPDPALGGLISAVEIEV
jgi:hypothetical protein